MRLWAIERAEFRNAHFVHRDQPTPWTVEDILDPDPGARARRQMEARKSHMAVTRFNAALGRMKKGEDHPLARKWTDADLAKVDWGALSRRPPA